MPESHTSYHVTFQSSALGATDLFLRKVHGTEELTRLFEFDIEVETVNGEPIGHDDLDAMMHGSAFIAFGEDDEHKIHGVIRRIEMLSVAEPGPVHYKIRFVPKLFDTTLTFGTWVYQEMTVPEIVQDVLTDAGFGDGEDFEMQLTGTYPKREYTVQYQESDFNFISRLIEHEGIGFYFDHSGDQAKVVFVDANAAFQPLADHENIVYEPRAGVTSLQEHVSSWDHAYTMIPAHVTLRDYNYRTPSTPLVGTADIAGLALGKQLYYGDHFKTPSEGRHLAQVRAEEIALERNTFRGTTSVRGLRSGHRFTLTDHLIDGLDIEYLVTSVVHDAAQGTSGDNRETRGYGNAITAIPYAVPYRPKRITPKPRIYGVTHGKIDAPADNQHATPIDDQGRYKVLLPYDVVGKAGGKASRWIRMAQTASGGGYGMHFPLHMGTEVLLVHIDGDPDRPIIVGSVPNAETTSPVTRANATQSAMRTRNGIHVSMDDLSE